MSWELIAGVAGAVVLIGNAGAMIYKWIRPALMVKQKVEELDRRTVNDFEAIKEMREAIERSDQVNQLHLNVMLKMLNHMIDGNGKEEMRKTRDDIQDMLAGIEK
jgi:hypothetical protein